MELEKSSLGFEEGRRGPRYLLDHVSFNHAIIFHAVTFKGQNLEVSGHHIRGRTIIRVNEIILDCGIVIVFVWIG
jgi:hypothetical protein